MTAKKPEPAAPPVAEGMVRVQCIVHSQPWANGKPLNFKEIADVTDEDAALLEANEQVVRLG